MSKKVLSALLCVTMILSLVGCGKNTSGVLTPYIENESTNGDSITLVYAEVNPLDSIVGQTASEFKKKVEELSSGKIMIDLQHSGTLGSETDVLDTMLAGGDTIQLARISAFSLANYGGKKSILLSLPYTFVSREHFWNFANSDLATEFLAEPSENGSGVRGLFYGEEGFRHFFTVDEISSIEDLAGMKLRVGNDPIMNGLVEGLAASPMEVAFNELYSALQTGVVDGAEQPIANYKSNKFPEVASNMIMDGHTLGAIQVIISDKAWNSLTPEQQGWLTEAGQYAADFNRQISEEAESKVIEELKKEGVNLVEVTDIKPWQEATADLIAKQTKGYEDLYQQILDLQ